MKKMFLAAILLSTSAAAHEMTPTYVELEPSYIEGVYLGSIELWNRRNDVEYYEVSVLDEMWNGIPFATSERVFKVAHLGKKKIEIYVREGDVNDIEYICTSSKQLKSDVISTGVKSMICSRIER